MSIRRQIRLRKEFIHKKTIDNEQIIRNNKKRQLKIAIDENKSIPTEIVQESRELYHELEMDVHPIDSNNKDSSNSYIPDIDDEYSNICIVNFREDLSYVVVVSCFHVQYTYW